MSIDSSVVLCILVILIYVYKAGGATRMVNLV